MSDVLVIGLAGRRNDRSWHVLLDGRRVHARSSMSLDASINVDRSYDDLFNQADLRSVPTRIADDLTQAAQDRPVAYLVPGWARLGDATVEELAKQDQVTLQPDVVDSVPSFASTLIVDALALATAQLSAPFAAGLVPLDASQPIVVSNWYGDSVTSLASEMLRQMFGQKVALIPNDDTMLTIHGKDPLAGGSSMAALRHIYARLRRPDGCPWDREQSELSTVPHIVEEAGELREALAMHDWQHSADELGDILGNVLMIAQIAEEQGRFTFEDVVTAVSEKLVRRHPHVFGDLQAATPEEVLDIWNTVKQQERERQ
jgi:tetrapyrrole methylase family protein/MazG family protein